jgi:hypothetical protein
MGAEARFTWCFYTALKRRSSTLMRGHFSTLRYLFDGLCFILDSVPRIRNRMCRQDANLQVRRIIP